MSLYVGDRVVCRFRWNRVTYTRGRIDTIDCPDDEHLVARNMKRIGINKCKKKIVLQVGYLQRYLIVVVFSSIFYGSLG